LSAKRLLGLIVAAVALAAGLVLFVLNRRVDQAFETSTAAESAVEFVVVPEREPLPFWGSDDVEAVVELPGGLYAAGGFGVARLEPSRERIGGGFVRVDISSALPTRRASALSAWRNDLVAGLDQGGFYLYKDGSWSEAHSGFGVLHIRALVETPAGELWIGAREGLFRLGLAERAMTRLHASPVRSVSIAEGGLVVSGGEAGAFSTQGGVTNPMTLEGDTRWVEDVVALGRRVFAITPIGLLAQGSDGALRTIAGGGNVGSIVRDGDDLLATTDPPDTTLRRFEASGAFQIERLPSTMRRAFSTSSRVLADTELGLVEKTRSGWAVILRRAQPGLVGHAHVGALGSYRDRLMVGFFDGGIAELVSARPDHGTQPPGTAPEAQRLALRPITAAASSTVWAVNALLNAGGALHIASLRGAFRFDGVGFQALEGSGAAFSLAPTSGGVAIGYGEGVLLPERKLLSAFHGLPGNQAIAVAPVGAGLMVGTPSGLGFIEDHVVRWRVASGEGKLPHPWVTAILPLSESTLIGTYGGGLVRRTGALNGAGNWQTFAETQGLKINPGCLVEAHHRIYAGTDGDGVFRLSMDGTRFERLKLALPSPRVTALFEKDGFLYIGTDEGLTRWLVDGEAAR
jgi:hypothetical protein